MPRRVFTYPDLPGWGILNLASTVGAFILGASVLVFGYNLVRSLRRGALAGDDPWDAWTLEWATTSPPAPHNFDRVPPVRGRRPLWDLKHPDTSEVAAWLPPVADTQLVPDKNLVLVWAFVVSEATFFVVLVLSYIFFNLSSKAAADALDAKTTGLFTLCLVASSATLHVAEKSHTKNQVGRFRAWLIGTVLLGSVFLAGQAHEYTRLLERGISVSSSLFASTFFTLTGFHGLHVALGLVALGVLLGLTFAGGPRAKWSRALEAIGVYWHFVDVVWIAVFSVVYLRSVL